MMNVVLFVFRCINTDLNVRIYEIPVSWKFTFSTQFWYIYIFAVFSDVDSDFLLGQIEREKYFKKLKKKRKYLYHLYIYIYKIFIKYPNIKANHRSCNLYFLMFIRFHFKTPIVYFISIEINHLKRTSSIGEGQGCRKCVVSRGTGWIVQEKNLLYSCLNQIHFESNSFHI